MAKTYSWKIDSNNYAYLYIASGDGRHVCERITDPAKLNSMVEVMKTWSAEDAESAFNEMAKDVHRLYPNKTMEWDPAYWTSGGTDSSVVVLTGKDGSSMDEARLNELFEGYKMDVGALIGQMGIDVSGYTAAIESALTAKIDAVISDLTNRVNSAVTDFEVAKEDLNDKITNTSDKVDNINIVVSGIPTNITDKLDKIDEVDRKIDDVITPILDIDFSGITDGIDKINDIVPIVDNFFNDDDPGGGRNHKDISDVVDEWDAVNKRLKDLGLIDTGAEDDIDTALNYFSYAVIQLSGDTSNNTNRIAQIDENIDSVVSGKVQEMVSDSLSDLDNRVSGQVHTMVSSSLQEINNTISSLDDRVREIEQHSGSTSGSHSGDIDPHGDTGMTETSSDAPISNGNFTYSNNNGFVIEMTDNGITLSNSGATSSIVLDANGIWLYGSIHLSGTTFDNSLHAESGPQLNG